MSFDPRDLVLPPFVECPYCRQETFGVIGVYGDHYRQRCRSCLKPGRGLPAVRVDLPPIRKKVLYLDQFALTYAMYQLDPTLDPDRTQRSSRWSKVADLIANLVSAQLLVCPSSSFHIDEALPFARGAELRKLWAGLSASSSFEDPGRIETLQLRRALIEVLEGRQPTWMNAIVDPVIDPDPHQWSERLQLFIGLDFYAILQDEIRRFRDRRAESLRAVFLRWAAERPTFEQVYREEIASVGPMHLRMAAAYEDNVRAFFAGIGELPVENTSVHRTRELIRLCADRGFEQQAALRAVVDFLTTESSVEASPKMRVRAGLYAALARKAASGMSVSRLNDGMTPDFEMIATVAPYCDAILVDSFCAGLLNEQPLREWMSEFGVAVLSANDPDGVEQWLEQLRQTASDKHLGLVKQVYNVDFGRAS